MDEEQKNVDNNIAQCRKSLFGLLGPALSYKCKLSPLSQHHLWTVYALPVLLSGLSALPIRPTVMKTLTIFHNKILRGFLKLSKSSPVPALYFLLGELPLEARVHLSTLAFLHCSTMLSSRVSISSVVLSNEGIPPKDMNDLRFWILPEFLYSSLLICSKILWRYTKLRVNSDNFIKYWGILLTPLSYIYT